MSAQIIRLEDHRPRPAPVRPVTVTVHIVIDPLFWWRFWGLL